MRVTITESVRRSLNTLSPEDRNRVETWFSYLETMDPYARANSQTLVIDGQTVYMFVTSSNVRIFYTVDNASQTVAITHITNKETIISSGSIQGMVSP